MLLPRYYWVDRCVTVDLQFRHPHYESSAGVCTLLDIFFLVCLHQRQYNFTSSLPLIKLNNVVQDYDGRLLVIEPNYILQRIVSDVVNDIPSRLKPKPEPDPIDLSFLKKRSSADTTVLSSKVTSFIFNISAVLDSMEGHSRRVANSFELIVLACFDDFYNQWIANTSWLTIAINTIWIVGACFVVSRFLTRLIRGSPTPTHFYQPQSSAERSHPSYVLELESFFGYEQSSLGALKSSQEPLIITERDFLKEQNIEAMKELIQYDPELLAKKEIKLKRGRHVLKAERRDRFGFLSLPAPSYPIMEHVDFNLTPYHLVNRKQDFEFGSDWAPSRIVVAKETFVSHLTCALAHLLHAFLSFIFILTASDDRIKNQIAPPAKVVICRSYPDKLNKKSKSTRQRHTKAKNENTTLDASPSLESANAETNTSESQNILAIIDSHTSASSQLIESLS